VTFSGARASRHTRPCHTCLLPLTRGAAAHRGPRSRLAIAILLLRLLCNALSARLPGFTARVCLYQCCKSRSGCCTPYVSSVCSKCFICFRRMLQVLSACCKNRSGCCIYMHVASLYFKYFRCFIRMLQVFHLDVVYVCNSFQVFSSVFASVSNVRFKYFICLLLYVTTVCI
jgi:hypothetical protein